jgi:hypothetical protein
VRFYQIFWFGWAITILPTIHHTRERQAEKQRQERNNHGVQTIRALANPTESGYK